MKTIRLLFLLAWALAQVLPSASARPFEQVACSLKTPAVPTATANAEQPKTLAVTMIAASRSLPDVIQQQTQKAADTWRDFVAEWLVGREKMWIWMFLLLLLLARL